MSISESASESPLATPAVVSDARLEPGQIGRTQVLFQSITMAAPTSGVASGLIFAASYAGGSTPLMVVLATVAIGLVAISIAQLARHVPSAGGLYAYTDAGLGKIMSLLVAWALILGYALLLPLVIVLFAYIAQVNLTAHTGSPTWLWVPLAIACGLAVWWLVYRGISISTRVGVVLGVIEMAVFVVFAIWLIAEAGSRNTFSVFGPSHGNVHGLGSVFVGMIYAVLAYIGFEGCAPLAEEAREPRRTVPFALIGSVVGMGLFFLLCQYAITVYWGPTRVALGPHPLIAFNGGDPVSGIAAEPAVWGGAWFIVVLAICNSAFATTSSSTNATSRLAFSLARIRLLPTPIADTHAKHRTPHNAIHVVMIWSIACTVALGLAFVSPELEFAFLGTALTLVFIGIYAVTALSCIVYYLRFRRDEFNPILHLVVPLLAIAFLVPVFIASLGIDFGGLGIAPLVGKSRFAPIVVAVWMVVGLGVLPWLRRKRPASLSQLGRIFVDS